MGFLLFIRLITEQCLTLCKLINILDQIFIDQKIQYEMSDMKTNTAAAHLNASACRYRALLRSQPKVNVPIFFPSPSFLNLSAIYFYYKYDPWKASGMLLLIPKRIQGNRQGEKGTATDQHRKRKYPDQKESPAEHIIRCDKRHHEMVCRRGKQDTSEAVYTLC